MPGGPPVPFVAMLGLFLASLGFSAQAGPLDGQDIPICPRATGALDEPLGTPRCAAHVCSGLVVDGALVPEPGLCDGLRVRVAGATLAVRVLGTPQASLSGYAIEVHVVDLSKSPQEPGRNRSGAWTVGIPATTLALRHAPQYFQTSGVVSAPEPNWELAALHLHGGHPKGTIEVYFGDPQYVSLLPVVPGVFEYVLSEADEIQ